jgi:hypothetical protein
VCVCVCVCVCVWFHCVRAMYYKYGTHALIFRLLKQNPSRERLLREEGEGGQKEEKGVHLYTSAKTRAHRTPYIF